MENMKLNENYSTDHIAHTSSYAYWNTYEWIPTATILHIYPDTLTTHGDPEWRKKNTLI